MKKLIYLFFIVIFLGGCAGAETFIAGTDYTDYKKRAQEIETSYQKGEITKAEYLDLKLKNEQLYRSPKEK